MIRNLSKKDSAAALAEKERDLAAANKRAADVDTKHAQACAAMSAASTAQAALASRIAIGEGVSASDASAASAAIVDAREHVELLVSAKTIAAKAVAEADEAFRYARFNEAQHVVKSAKRARATALRVLAKAGSAFGEAVESASAAGSALLQAHTDAVSAAKLPHLAQMPNPFDVSTTATRFLCRALPGNVITAIRETPISPHDFAAEADRLDAEANL